MTNINKKNLSIKFLIFKNNLKIFKNSLFVFLKCFILSYFVFNNYYINCLIKKLLIIQ